MAVKNHKQQELQTGKKKLSGFKGEWKTVKVRDIGEIITGRTPNLYKKEVCGNDFPWVTPTDIIGTNPYISKTGRMLSEYGIKTTVNLPEHTVLITCIASIGKNAILKKIGSCNQQINAIICYPSYNYLFIYYLLTFFSEKIIVISGITATRIVSKKVFGDMEFLIPAKEEQAAIADSLSDADALISSLEQLIAKKRLVKQGAMQELLTGKKRLPGFEGEWLRLRLGECAIQVRDFSTFSDAACPCIELDDIISSTGKLIRKSLKIKDVYSIKLKFQYNDILFGRLRSYLKKYFFAKFSGACSPEFWVLRAVEANIVPQYLYQIIQTDFFIEATSVTYGTHMPRSDWNIVKNIFINLPSSLTEQAAIAAVLSDMDEEISALEAKLAKARKIKAGMMAELLSGRIRLV